MVLENKLGLIDSAELAREEERISKKKAVNLFDFAILKLHSDGTYKTLAAIHKYLFEDIYDFAGELRTVNMQKAIFTLHRLCTCKRHLKISTKCRSQILMR